jgi:hypothetical protein
MKQSQRRQAQSGWMRTFGMFLEYSFRGEMANDRVSGTVMPSLGIRLRGLSKGGNVSLAVKCSFSRVSRTLQMLDALLRSAVMVSKSVITQVSKTMALL